MFQTKKYLIPRARPFTLACALVQGRCDLTLPHTCNKSQSFPVGTYIHWILSGRFGGGDQYASSGTQPTPDICLPLILNQYICQLRNFWRKGGFPPRALGERVKMDIIKKSKIIMKNLKNSLISHTQGIKTHKMTLSNFKMDILNYFNT